MGAGALTPGAGPLLVPLLLTSLGEPLGGAFMSPVVPDAPLLVLLPRCAKAGPAVRVSPTSAMIGR
jgi:hypothetical protein